MEKCDPPPEKKNTPPLVDCKLSVKLTPLDIMSVQLYSL